MEYPRPSYIHTPHSMQLMPAQLNWLLCQGERRMPTLPAGTAQPPASLRTGRGSLDYPGLKPSPPEGRTGTGAYLLPSFHNHALAEKERNALQSKSWVLGEE